MEIQGNLYRVYRAKRVYPELGYNESIVCARSENEAKGIAIAGGLAVYKGESKKNIKVEQITEANIGDVLLMG